MAHAVSTVPVNLVQGSSSAGVASSEDAVLSDKTGSEVVKHLSCNMELKDLFAMDAGVSEGYTIGEHTAMVIDVARRYRESLEPAVSKMLSWDHFILLLALHDIGKGVSNAHEDKQLYSNPVSRKASELRSTRAWLDSNCEKMGISKEITAIFMALLETDSVGGFLKGEISGDQFFYDIVAASLPLQKSPVDFYNLMRAFHTVDAASYPGLMQSIFREVDGGLCYLEESEKKLASCREKLIAADRGRQCWDEISQAHNLHAYIVDNYQALRSYVDLISVHAVEDPDQSREMQAVMGPKIAEVFTRLLGREISASVLNHDTLEALQPKEIDDLLIEKQQYLKRYEIFSLFWSMYLLLRMHQMDEAGIATHFVHGTRSTTLAVMDSTDQQLLPTGVLSRLGVAPLSGEHSNTVGIGVNKDGISATSIEGGERAANYSEESLHQDANYNGFLAREEKVLKELLEHHHYQVKLAEEKGRPYFSSIYHISNVNHVFDAQYLSRAALAIQRLQVLGEESRIAEIIPGLKEMVAIIREHSRELVGKKEGFCDLMPEELNEEPEFKSWRKEHSFTYHDYTYFNIWNNFMEGIEKLETIIDSKPLPCNLSFREALRRPFPLVFGFRAQVAPTQTRHEFKVLHALKLGYQINCIFTQRSNMSRVHETLRARGLENRVQVHSMQQYREMMVSARQVMHVEESIQTEEAQPCLLL